MSKKTFLDNSLKIISEHVSYSLTPLLKAVYCKQREIVDILLSCEQIDINAVDDYGRSALFLLVERFDTVDTKLFISRGAKQKKDLNGLSPLTLASVINSYDIVRILISTDEYSGYEIQRALENIALHRLLCGNLKEAKRILAEIAFYHAGNSNNCYELYANNKLNQYYMHYKVDDQKRLVFGQISSADIFNAQLPASHYSSFLNFCRKNRENINDFVFHNLNTRLIKKIIVDPSCGAEQMLNAFKCLVERLDTAVEHDCRNTFCCESCANKSCIVVTSRCQIMHEIVDYFAMILEKIQKTKCSQSDEIYKVLEQICAHLICRGVKLNRLAEKYFNPLSRFLEESTQSDLYDFLQKMYLNYSKDEIA